MRAPNQERDSAVKEMPADGAAATSNSAPTLEEALDTDRGRLMPRTMRLAASKYVRGETPSQIASAMGMEPALVRKYLGEAVRSLHCQFLSLNIPERDEEKVERHRAANAGALTGEQLLIEARCAGCQGLIEENEERTLAAGMMVECHREDDRDGMDYTVGLRVGQALHYCSECTDKTQQFRIPNPWFVPDSQRKATAEYMAEAQAEAEREAAAENAALSVALAAGNTSAFNSAMPTSAARDDVMARSVAISGIAAQIAKRQGDSAHPAEIAEQLFADDERWEKLEAAREAASGSAEATQRERLRQYLNSPDSRGMPHKMR
jgi:hypothetical protein